MEEAAPLINLSSFNRSADSENRLNDVMTLK